MPYICLARNDIPAGSAQILDLVPNASQRSRIYDPPPATRYLKRPLGGEAMVDPLATVAISTTGIIEQDIHGIAAYLLDRVQPGGLLVAGCTVTCVGVQVGDTVTIKGVVFTAAAAENIPARQFNQAAGNNACATSLAACVNAAANITLVRAGVGPTDRYVSGVAALNVVTFQARWNGNLQAGPLGSMTLVTSNNTRLVNTAAVLGRTFRATEIWTRTMQQAVIAGALVRVDAGSVMALANINAVLVAAGATGTELTNAGGSQSTGSVRDFLSLLAGRDYLLPRLDPWGTAQQVMSATRPTYAQNIVILGGFTQQVRHPGAAGMDTQSIELTSNSIGGDLVAVEVGGINHTFDGASFRRSLALGHIAVFGAVAGTGREGVAIRPDSDLTPHFPWDMQGALGADVAGPGGYAPVVNGTRGTARAINARVITVYDDDGTVLA